MHDKFHPPMVEAMLPNFRQPALDTSERYQLDSDAEFELSGLQPTHLVSKVFMEMAFLCYLSEMADTCINFG